MDANFHPAIEAIKASDVERLRGLVESDPTVATSRSTTSHPTLLQCLVLDAKDSPHQLEMARVLIDAGADVHEPVVAAAGIDNVAAVAMLLDRGAAIDGTRGGWSPLEEALYWNARGAIALLVQRGAAIQNLRIAAGLGRTDAIECFFETDGSLRPNAGPIKWPWGDLSSIECSNHGAHGKHTLAAKYATFKNDRQGIIDNALVYACMHGHVPAAALLLEKGAHVNAIPGGFDYSGTALHYAAMNGHRAVVDLLLERGADVTIEDMKVGSTPAGWADHGGHPEIGNLLRQRSVGNRA